MLAVVFARAVAAVDIRKWDIVIQQRDEDWAPATSFALLALWGTVTHGDKHEKGQSE